MSFTPASPDPNLASVPPVSQEMPLLPAPESSLGEKPTHARDRSNVAVLGFSSSGKTVYLTMLYYHTAVQGASPSDRTEKPRKGQRRRRSRWRADWLSLDGGATLGHLMPMLCDILGQDRFGTLRYRDKTTKRELERKFPGGTTSQTELQFKLFHHNGIREHELNILTLETKGEVQLYHSSSPSQIDSARDALWQRVREHCSDSSAVLLFFNLLTMGDQEQAAQLRTLVDTLMLQRNKPKAVAIVITGADILRDAGEVERTKERFADQYDKSIEVLEAHNIAYDIFLISSVGNEFTRKKSDVELNDICRNHHRCAHCQELDPDPKKKPNPVDLMRPWDFIYENVHRRNPWTDRFSAGLEVVRRNILRTVLACMAFFLVLLAVLYTRASQKEARIKLELTKLEKIVPGSNEEGLRQLIDLDLQLTNDPLLRWFVKDPKDVPQDPRHQLAKLGDAISEQTLPKQIDALDSVIKSGVLTEPSLKTYAHSLIRELQLKAELEDVMQPPEKLESRIRAANTVLGKSGRETQESTRIDSAMQSLLSDLQRWLSPIRTEVEGRIKSESPGVRPDDDSRTAEVAALDSQLKASPLSKMPNGRTLSQQLDKLRQDFEALKAYGAIGTTQPEGETDIRTKMEKYDKFRKDFPGNDLATGVAVAEYMRLETRLKENLSAAALKKLPQVDWENITGDLGLLGEALQQYRGFVDKYRASNEQPEVLRQLRRMEDALKEEIPRIRAQAERELREFSSIPPPGLPKPVDLETTSVSQRAKEIVIESERLEADARARAEGVRNLARANGDKNLDTLANDLGRLHDIRAKYTSIARTTAAATEGEAFSAAAKTLNTFARTMPESHPARIRAELERDRMEDESLYRQMEKAFGSLIPPKEVRNDFSDKDYRDLLARYDGFHNSWGGRELAANDRKERFEAFLRSYKPPLKNWLEEAKLGRSAVQARFDAILLFRKIDEAYRSKTRPTSRKEELLEWIVDFEKRFKSSPQAANLATIKSKVVAWNEHGHRFFLDPRGFKTAEMGRVIVAVRVNAAGVDAPILDSVVEVVNGKPNATRLEVRPIWDDFTYTVTVEARRPKEAPFYSPPSRVINPRSFASDFVEAYPELEGTLVKFKVE